MNSAACIYRGFAMRRTATCILVLLSICLPVRASGQNLLAVQLIAHRGLAGQAPENSLAALEAAWLAGLHGAEIDVRTSRDGVLVLMHDATLDRTTNGDGAVDQTTWAKMRKLRLRNSKGQAGGQGVPALDRVLAWAVGRPGFRLALDLKQVDPGAVGRLVIKHGLADRVDLYVGGPERAEMIRTIKDFDRRLKVSLALGWLWRVEGVPGLTARAGGVDALFAAEWYFPARGFAEARRAGAEVQVYLWGDKDLPGRLRAAADLGAQVLSCDHPLRLMHLVVPRGGRIPTGDARGDAEGAEYPTDRSRTAGPGPQPGGGQTSSTTTEQIHDE